MHQAIYVSECRLKGRWNCEWNSTRNADTLVRKADIPTLDVNYWIIYLSCFGPNMRRLQKVPGKHILEKKEHINKGKLQLCYPITNLSFVLKMYVCIYLIDSLNRGEEAESVHLCVSIPSVISEQGWATRRSQVCNPDLQPVCKEPSS